MKSACAKQRYTHESKFIAHEGSGAESAQFNCIHCLMSLNKCMYYEYDVTGENSASTYKRFENGVVVERHVRKHEDTDI